MTQQKSVDVEKEVINDTSTSSSNETDKNDSSNTSENVVTGVPDDQLQKAYDAFLAKGVPSIPLTRAFNFYRENRAVVGGLKDGSCLIKPMSETGEIPSNSNRFDPTTIEMLRAGIRNERYIMVVDFTQSNAANRGYLMDLKPDANGNYTLLRMQIAHGYGSQAVNGIPQKFTNASGYGTTVSGFFITGSQTYKYYGHASGKEYSSTGLRLYGLESTNNTAEKTSKVAHGAPYVTSTSAGNSAGCPAMTVANSAKLLSLYTGGMLWYHHTKSNNSLTYKSASCGSSLAAAQ